jgi:phosphomannomutase
MPVGAGSRPGSRAGDAVASGGAAARPVVASWAMDELVFGTDGWRALVGDGFTHVAVARAARAYAAHLKAGGAHLKAGGAHLKAGGAHLKAGGAHLEAGEDRGTVDGARDRAAGGDLGAGGGGLVLVAHDTRFGGERFAAVAAATLHEEGLEVAWHRGPLPTPVLSFAVRHAGAAGGVMLTASHNPPEYQGFKIKGAYGGTALDETYRDVARRVGPAAGAPPPAAAQGLPSFDVRDAYYRQLAGLVDLEALRRVDGRVVHDAMGGAAGGWMRGFLAWAGARVEVDDLRGAPDPHFDGVSPEPLPANLARTREHLRARPGARFAVCTDGDGDRLAAVLPDGRFFDPHQVFAVLLDLLDRRGGPGAVVKTFTVSRLIERLAEARGRAVRETPVGFKYLVEPLRAGEALIAGEESGGIGVRGHVPERDGILAGLLLLEAEALAGEPLAARFAALEAEADWRHAYERVDLRLDGPGLAARVAEALARDPASFAGNDVTSVERLDGVKLNLAGHRWVLFRPSGTEPVLRLYVEGPGDDAVAGLVAAARAFVADL